MERAMSDLTADDFDRYFKDVHGQEPYPWQSRLTRQVLAEERWPNVIDLPTGVGKTAVLDTAIFALAACPDISPRRIVFVIDRRIVVDQVYERARHIRDQITAATGGVLADVQSRLRELTDAEPLGVAALRGGIPIDGEWARRPEQPWVMVSTVDQFGSRLLFRGYGVSHRMRPVHAGLAGNDCLVILDEVHLSRAFAATLRDASSDGAVPLMRAVSGGLPRRFQVVEMSATPTSASGWRFELEDSDLDQAQALKRIAAAPKRAKLVEIGGPRPPHESVPKKVLEIVKKELSDDESPNRSLESAQLDLETAIEEMGDGEQSVGVIVNRVRTARQTCDTLREAGIEAFLVTGRMRPLDRKQILRDISKSVDPDRREPLDQRTVVVATQAIEVGADFSFDALISEVAPIDSLCQRLGRLDRRGTLAVRRGGPARCWILGAASALNPKRPDPVYGDSARRAWEELQACAEDGEIDVGPGAGLLSSFGPDTHAPKPKEPLLLPTHVEAWSQTSPEPVVDPPIAEFLHGKERQQEPDVSVVWRWDRTPRALELVPPRPAEFLSVPVSAVTRWLRGSAEEPVADTALTLPQGELRSPGRTRGEQQSAVPALQRVVRWTRHQDAPAETLEHVDDINPGDVIVADPMLGGLRNGTWDPTFRPTSRTDESGDDDPPPVDDLGDEAQVVHGRRDGDLRGARATLRLDQRLRERIASKSGRQPPGPTDEQDAERTPREVVKDWLSEIQGLPSLPDWMERVVGHFVAEERFAIETVESESEPDYYVLVGHSVDPTALDESDDAPSLTGTKTPLRSHLAGVGARAADYGSRLGLSSEVVADLRLAGELHDLGKVDPRFQAQLHGHDPVRIAESEGTGEPLAKSLQRVRPHPGKWPPVRHEFSSVALAQSDEALLERAHDRDLVLHLVGTHHGFGRPLPTIRTDDSPEQLKAVGWLDDEGFRLRAAGESRQVEESGGPVSMTMSSDLAETALALEMADRFWRLQERYGHHGLAWLEAIIRLADHQQSAEESQQSAKETR